MNTPIELTNPLSDHPTEMWRQAITDFEEVLGTPGYEIDMGCWYERFSDEPCLVCMAGATMARRAEDLPHKTDLGDFDGQTALKLSSVDSMRRGHFLNAINCLPLPQAERFALHEAVRQAITRTDIDEIEVAGISRDWRGLIKLLREAIARIDGEYVRLDPASD